MDCSAQSPKGRRSVCYDREALEARKEHKPKSSAVDMATAMGAALLTVDGQVGLALRPGDTVRCSRAPIGTRLMILDGDGFYQKLQTRLRLGERFSE